MRQVIVVADVILAVLVVLLCLLPWIFQKHFLVKTYVEVMKVLDEYYLCGYSICKLIMSELFGRLGDLNDEGFCFTVSAAIMLALKDVKTARLVRGNVREIGEHSWVEIKYLGRFWVIDPLIYVGGFASRASYYRMQGVRVVVAYRYQQFWHDTAAEKFYKRLSYPATSCVFVDLFWYYTPVEDIREKLGERKGEPQFCASGQYYIFAPEYGYLFNQRIINELMARPTRRAPKKRTIRRLYSQYRETVKL